MLRTEKKISTYQGPHQNTTTWQPARCKYHFLSWDPCPGARWNFSPNQSSRRQESSMLCSYRPLGYWLSKIKEEDTPSVISQPLLPPCLSSSTSQPYPTSFPQSSASAHPPALIRLGLADRWSSSYYQTVSTRAPKAVWHRELTM